MPCFPLGWGQFGSTPGTEPNPNDRASAVVYDDAVLVELLGIIDEGIGAAKSVFMERASLRDVVAHGFAAMGGHGGQENVKASNPMSGGECRSRGCFKTCRTTRPLSQYAGRRFRVHPWLHLDG